MSVERLVSLRGLLGLGLPLAASTGLGYFLQYANRTVLAWHSPEALAAALPAGLLAWTFQGLFILACGYLGSFAAQHVGAGEDDEAGAMVWPMHILALVAAVLAAVLIPFRHAIVAIFAPAPEVAAPMAELLAWYLAETAPLAVVSGLAGFAGGIGRTRLVLVLSVLGCLLAILLNYLLVMGPGPFPRWGITGGGIATVTTPMIMGGVWWWWLTRPIHEARFHLRRPRWEPARLARFCRFAVPRGATEVLEMVSFVAFTAVITRLGTDALAASNLAFNTYLIVLVPLLGFCQGVGIAVGTAQGAGRVDLARHAVANGLRLLMPYLLVLMLLFALVPAWLLAPAQADPRHVTLALPVMACLVALIPADGLQWLWRFAIQGAGDTRWPMVMVLFMGLTLLALPAWLLVPWLTDPRVGLISTYLLMAGYTTVVAGVMAWRFYRGPWPGMSVRMEISNGIP